MFGRKKEVKPPSRRSGQSLAQYGLFDVPDNLDNMGASDPDSDLEAELAAIAGGGAKARPKPKPKAIPQADLDSLVADSLRDIPSDEEMSDGEDDPDLLNELSELADDEPPPEAPPRVSRPAPPPPGGAGGVLVALLQERIQMYTQAEQNAKTTGETSRLRRLTRGLKTLKDQLKQAMAGKAVNEEDIPPAVSITVHPAPPPGAVAAPAEEPQADLPAPIQPTVVTPESPRLTAEESDAVSQLSEEAKATLNLLNDRKTQYKSAALLAKRNGDNATALAYIKTLKQFDHVMEAVRAGQTVDLSNMPGPPGEDPPAAVPPPALPPRQTEHLQTSTEESPSVPEDSAPEGLITASTVEEALQQRLDLYKQQEAAAKEANNSSKARRMGRIVKQFEQAMKQHRAGKTIPYDELPTPPGYAPIPGAPAPPAPEPEAAPPPPDTSEAPTEEAPSAGGAERPGSLATAGRSNSVRKMGNHFGTGLAGQQLNTLLQRQREFKEAALEAKKKGELAEAKEYLRCSKGFDPLIDAARGGLPVDLSSVPIPPQAKRQLEDSYDIVNSEDCNEEEDGGGMLGRLEQQLGEQLKMCLDTGEHHKAMGDVSGANRFQHLALAVKQDIDVVKMAKRLGSNSVKFHYENKQFSIVQCCTDLGDNDLELTIVRGISYTVPNPKDIDTYVKYEFPYPQEEPVSDKTALVKDTNSPEYNAVFTIPINRTARPCLRVFKRQAVKLEVYSRGGFFSRDSLLGTINVKLQPLETQTELHDSFDLMNGRKAVGGKLEIKIRVRNPMLTKQIEQSTRKWLVIDH